MNAPSKRTLLLESAPQGTVHESFPSHGSDFLKASGLTRFFGGLFSGTMRV